jgi:hypothetical protein
MSNHSTDQFTLRSVESSLHRKAYTAFHWRLRDRHIHVTGCHQLFEVLLAVLLVDLQYLSSAE